eukprot:TRINITY_DN6630_c0_g1_i1.p1 TRINITY_DN6630_c0_g1~~TRINITY_DN6630_c0_g1_i1.p1  ORF type:complete len:510 (-),score=119.45 TRINITY_DN6630_c0_g1_i1:151-1680(-)
MARCVGVNWQQWPQSVTQGGPTGLNHISSIGTEKSGATRVFTQAPLCSKAGARDVKHGASGHMRPTLIRRVQVMATLAFSLVAAALAVSASVGAFRVVYCTTACDVVPFAGAFWDCTHRHVSPFCDSASVRGGAFSFVRALVWGGEQHVTTQHNSPRVQEASEVWARSVGGAMEGLGESKALLLSFVAAIREHSVLAPTTSTAMRRLSHDISRIMSECIAAHAAASSADGVATGLDHAAASDVLVLPQSSVRSALERMRGEWQQMLQQWEETVELCAVAGANFSSFVNGIVLRLEWTRAAIVDGEHPSRSAQRYVEEILAMTSKLHAHVRAICDAVAVLARSIESTRQVAEAVRGTIASEASARTVHDGSTGGWHWNEMAISVAGLVSSYCSGSPALAVGSGLVLGAVQVRNDIQSAALQKRVLSSLGESASILDTVHRFLDTADHALHALQSHLLRVALALEEAREASDSLAGTIVLESSAKDELALAIENARVQWEAVRSTFNGALL